MKLKDSELNSILAEVEAELADLAKSEGAKLAKAAGDEPDGDEASQGAPEASASAPDASAPEASAPDASAPEASASPDASASPVPEESTSAAAPDAPMDPAADQSAGPVDPAALKAEYSALDPESLKMHYMAAKAALFEMMGADGAGPDAGSPTAPDAGSPAGPPVGPPDGPPAMKAEISASPANGNALKDQPPAFMASVKKSEAEAKAKIHDLENQVELLTKAVETVLTKPMRKAVTSVAFLSKPEHQEPPKPASKADIQAKIRNALHGGKLTKSEKTQLFSFTLGNATLESIQDLLDRK